MAAQLSLCSFDPSFPREGQKSRLCSLVARTFLCQLHLHPLTLASPFLSSMLCPCQGLDQICPKPSVLLFAPEGPVTHLEQSPSQGDSLLDGCNYERWFIIVKFPIDRKSSDERDQHLCQNPSLYCRKVKRRTSRCSLSFLLISGHSSS